MRQWQFNVIIISFSLLIVKCSSEYHLNKAIKKDPSIQTEVVDTLTFTRILRDTIHTSDSTYYVKETEVRYDTIVKYVKVQADFSEKKSRFQIRQEEKTERKKIKNDRKEAQTQIRQEEKTDRVEIRQDAKTERGNSWWWIWLSIGILIGVFINRAFETTMRNLKM